MQAQALQEKSAIRGIVTITNYVIDGNERAREIDERLRSAHNLSNDEYCALVEELHSICEVKQVVKYNLVHLAAREMYAKLLIGEATYTGEINYGALGTSSAAITDADTTLTTEVARKLIASKTRTNDSVTIDFYYSKSDTNGTYQEFGCFVDGTATVDTGLMFNRVLTGGWVKSSSEAMTVSIQFDFNAP